MGPLITRDLYNDNQKIMIHGDVLLPNELLSNLNIQKGNRKKVKHN